LYKPYSENATLATTLLYWTKQAQGLDVSVEIRDSAIAEAFLEIAQGKEFPVGTCDCGCEFPIKWSCVALNHYVLKKMIAKKTEIDIDIAKHLQDKLHLHMLGLIKMQNEEYVKEQMKPPNRLIDFSRSPVLKMIRRK